MSITTADIKLLRESTGAGVLDCKKALQETNGNIDEAIEYLRKKGLAAAAKKASREANDGLVSAKVTPDHRVGAMVEVNCETDFVARTDDFQQFVNSLVQQVLEQPSITNAESLLAAPYSGDKNKTVEQAIPELVAKVGENIVIRHAARFELQDEGIIDSYIHPGSRVGVLVEVAGGSPDNRRLVEVVHDIALQIAAASPRYVGEADVPSADLEAEKVIYRAQLADDKKPDNIKERIIDGKVSKWYSEVVLLNQEFVKDSSITIAQLLKNTSKDLGKDLTVRRFARFELGMS